MNTMNAQLDPKALAAHVLVVLARAQRTGRSMTVHDVAVELDVRKNDVRTVVSRLHDEGHVDALRMKLTLSGLALATAMREGNLRVLRVARANFAAA